ncbi:hypothetical protein LMB33_04790 [Limosilactobacillus reuteri]|uniref:hypothetical protein n=1 Tax=Limosilactobacillus reuteri TaxID=1598 RepID=UPI001E5317B7|nr:hypothetical protein [Limosilactobacillus reuteri]MCC4329687.1 hypothetical protein [Limosilactobacillus reuteri]
MSEFKLPHVEDLRTDATLIRGLQEDFKAIEQEDKDDDQALSDEVTDRKKGDGNLQGQINKLQERCQKLEDQVKQLRKANDNHEERLKKIERLLFGSQSINATTISANESDHQGYEIADIPPYDYTEQEIN